MNKIATVALTVLSVLSSSAAGEGADSITTLQPNKWAKLPCKAEAGYIFSTPVFTPSRGQVLHWGAVMHVYGVPYAPRNDVRAFDVASGDWVSDYPSDPPASGLGAAGNAGSFNQTVPGRMLANGRPWPNFVMNGGVYDSKRDRLVYTMRGLMAAYDPKARTWTDLKAKTIMPHPVGGWNPVAKEFAGGPPVCGQGACYDPVNDEIVLFPHFDAKNISLREATGQISGHYGTFRYTCKDNTWTLVSDTFGSDGTKKARRDVIGIMAQASAAMDAAWVLNRKPDAAKAADAGKQAQAAADAAASLVLPGLAKSGDSALPGLLRTAAAALAANKAGVAIAPLRDALWSLNELLDSTLRVEPPARCAAPMVYDPKNKAIVMFGGQTNLARTDLANPDVLAESGLNDTWLYDVKTRQWREIAAANRPPRQRVPLLAYDSGSGLALLVAISPGKPGKVALWSLDVGKEEWSRRDEQDWGWPVMTTCGSGDATTATPHSAQPTVMLGFDEKARLLLLMQPEQGGQATYAMKLDLDKLPAAAAPAWTPPVPLKPFEAAQADDPAWVDGLKKLPANTWVPAKPAKGPAPRSWGILAYDPIRGQVVYFGGGHSTYQINNVDVYSVGANTWTASAGDHNAFVPPDEWEGTTLGHRGGPATGHQRNTYQVFDGRMYLLFGTDEMFPNNYVFHAEKDFARFYDMTRGGVWRDRRIAQVDRPDKVPPYPYVNILDPKGRLFNLIGEVPTRSAPNVTRYFISCLDLNEDKLMVKEVSKPIPEQCGLGEGRPFCYLPDRDQIFLMNAKPEDPSKSYSEDPKKVPLKQVTFLYDVNKNVFAELPAVNTPPVRAVQVAEYADSQKCVLAIIGNAQWVYSFEKGDWAPLPTKAEGGVRFEDPFAQVVWAAKYGVFVNTSLGATWVMRPDFGGLAFRAASTSTGNK
ncbi:MAG: kelch repeat-containing protein [Phycisphaerae bacterium]|nr:kelch repeat-containing protein [Phycisphaerae bacterium]